MRSVTTTMGRVLKHKRTTIEGKHQWTEQADSPRQIFFKKEERNANRVSKDACQVDSGNELFYPGRG